MGRFRESWAAVSGQAPSRELVEARRAVDGVSARRRVAGVVRRGAVAANPEEARLAVALAREDQRQRRLAGPLLLGAFGLLVLGWAWFAGSSLVAGDLALGLFFLAFTLFGIKVLVDRLRLRGKAEQAERRNLEYLQARGMTAGHQERSELVEPRGLELVAATAALFVFYVAGFGALTTAMDGEALSVSRVLERGILFGVFMTIFGLTFGRRRNRRSHEATDLN